MSPRRRILKLKLAAMLGLNASGGFFLLQQFPARPDFRSTGMTFRREQKRVRIDPATFGGHPAYLHDNSSASFFHDQPIEAHALR